MNAIEKHQLCASAFSALREGVGCIGAIPGLIRKIIEEHAWSEREVRPGKIIKLKNLRELITKKYPDGWGEDPKKVEAIIKDDAEVLELYREAMVGKHGGDRKSEEAIKPDNRSLEDEYGTTRSYTLSRLKREFPELFQRVVDKELSANAAAIQAGFRVKTISIPINAEKAAQAILRHFTPEDCAKIKGML